MTQQELNEEQSKTNLYRLFRICQNDIFHIEISCDRFKSEWNISCSFDNKQLNYRGELNGGVKWMLEHLEHYGFNIHV